MGQKAEAAHNALYRLYQAIGRANTMKEKSDEEYMEHLMKVETYTGHRLDILMAAKDAMSDYQFDPDVRDDVLTLIADGITSERERVIDAICNDPSYAREAGYAKYLMALSEGEPEREAFAHAYQTATKFAFRKYFLSRYKEYKTRHTGDGALKTSPSQDWIPWRGGTRPMLDVVYVQAKFRNGCEGIIPTEIDKGWEWTGGPFDILAYKLPAALGKEGGE
jgi:hypothetical protein